MRGMTAKRIRKATLSKTPNQFILIEVSNYFGELAKEFRHPIEVYKAAKATYKNLRLNGKHDRANLFLLGGKK